MKTCTKCPSTIDFARAISGEASAAVLRHISQCPECATLAANQQHAIAIARQKIPAQISNDRIARIQTELVSKMAGTKVTRKKSGRIVIWAAAAMLLAGTSAGCYLWYIGQSKLNSNDIVRVSHDSGSRGQVYSADPARYRVVSRQPDEIVRLYEGKITVSVNKLAKGERYRVVTGDATVEVKGTVFDVNAQNDKLLSVRVVNGMVAVQTTGHAPVLLTEGQEWKIEAQSPANQATEATSSKQNEAIGEKDTGIPPAKESSVKHELKSAPRRNRENHSQSSAEMDARRIELVFTDGWQKLRRGDFDGAAADFEKVMAAPAKTTVQEDAAYWRIIAHKRSGKSHLAKDAMVQYVTLYPHSRRAAEVFVLLGQMALATGNLDVAAKYFHQGLNSAQSKTRQSAKKGLEAIDRQRQNQ